MRFVSDSGTEMPHSVGELRDGSMESPNDQEPKFRTISHRPTSMTDVDGQLQ